MSSDIEKAKGIVGTRTWQGPGGKDREATRHNIAVMVAEGIALGRSEGLELAAQLIAEERSRLSKSE